MKSARFPSVVLVMLFALLASCASGGSQSVSLIEPQPADTTGPAALPGLPTEHPVPNAERIPAVSLTQGVGGSSALDHNGAPESPFHLRLTPVDGADLKHAIYRFAALTPDSVVSKLDAQLSSLTADETVYFAFSDYSTGQWEFIGKTTPGSAATFDLAGSFDPQRFLTEEGFTYIAVLAFGADVTDCLVEQLNLEFERALGVPQEFWASDGARSDEVFLDWDAVPGADAYDIFYKLAAEGDETYELLATVEGLTTSFDHFATNPPGKGSEYDTIYEYRVRASAGLETSDFSEPDTGFRRTAQPSLYPANRGYVDRVAFHYQFANFDDPSTVDIFRNGALVVDDQPIDNNTGFVFDTFADVADPIPGEHTYTMIVNGPLGPSLESEPVTGCIAEWDGTVFTSQTDTAEFLADFDEDLDPAQPGPAFCYHDSLSNRIVYSVDTLDGVDKVNVGQSFGDFHPSLENHAGVPWAAFGLTAGAGEEAGIYIAFGDQANPADGGSFSNYRIHAAVPIGNQVVLKEVNGKLAALFTADIGLGMEALIYMYATVTNPTEPDDWAVSHIVEAATGTVPTVFDFADLGGFPAGMYLLDSEVLFFTTGETTPDNNDWDSHGAHDTFVLDPPQGVDVLVHEGLMHCAYMFGATEENGEIGYLKASDEQPQSFFSWDDYVVTTFFDQRVTGTALAIADDGFPVIAKINNDVDWVEVYRPFILGTNIQFGEWAGGQLKPDDSSYDRKGFNISEPRMMIHDGHIKLLYGNNFSSIGSARQLHVFTLGNKPE